MNNTVFYDGYIIEVYDTKDDYRYTIQKDGKLITESMEGFPMPAEAEVHAKLFINRLAASKNGWIIS